MTGETVFVRLQPAELEYRPGLKIGALTERAEIIEVIGILETDLAEIKSQLDDEFGVETTSTEVPTEWRRKATSALRMKKHALQYLRTKLSVMREEAKQMP